MESNRLAPWWFGQPLKLAVRDAVCVSMHSRTQLQKYPAPGRYDLRIDR